MALANLVFGNLQQSKRVLGLIKSNKSFLPFQSSYHKKKRARTIPHIKNANRVNPNKLQPPYPTKNINQKISQNVNREVHDQKNRTF